MLTKDLKYKGTPAYGANIRVGGGFTPKAYPLETVSKKDPWANIRKRS